MSAKKTVCILVPSNFLKTQLFLTLNSGCSRQWRCHEQEDILETRLPCGEKWGWHSYSSYHHIFVFWFVSVFVFVFVFETSLASVDGPCSLSSSVYIDALIHLPGYLGGDVSFTHTASCWRLDNILSGDGADMDHVFTMLTPSETRQDVSFTQSHFHAQTISWVREHPDPEALTTSCSGSMLDSTLKL